MSDNNSASTGAPVPNIFPIERQEEEPAQLVSLALPRKTEAQHSAERRAAIESGGAAREAAVRAEGGQRAALAKSPRVDAFRAAVAIPFPVSSKSMTR